MSQLIKLTCIAVLTLVVINKSWQVWRAPDDRPLRSATAGLLAALLALVVGQHPLEAWLDGLLPGLPQLLLNLVIASAFFGLLGFFVYSVHGDLAGRRRMRAHLGVLAGLLVLAVASWALAPGPVRAEPATPSTAGHPLGSTFLLAITVAMAYGLGLSLWYTIRAQRAASRTRLRRGLRVLTVGLTIMLFGRVLTVALVVTAWLAPPHAAIWPWLQGGYLLAMLSGVLGLTAGLSYPIVASLREALPRWIRHRREYRDLKPLWQSARAAFPDLVLARTWRPWSVHRLRYRRAIEIRDALVQLGPYYPRHEIGASVAEDGVAQQAARVAAALQAKVDDVSPGAAPHPIPTAAADTLDDEVRWLVELSRSMPGPSTSV